MGKIISFANQKGGVGKTTSAVNIAASLGLLDKKVLMVDLDPQGNTTSGVGVQKKGLKTTIREILLSPEIGGGKSPYEVAKQAIIKTDFKNLHLIPSTISLAGAEFDLFSIDNSEYILKEALTPLKEEYDYIIVDCPPSLGMLTINALAASGGIIIPMQCEFDPQERKIRTASDGIIIPMQCEFYALEGLSQLVITISRIKQKYNKDLTITGILLTMYNSRLLLTSQVVADLKKHYYEKLFSTAISRGVRLSEAPSYGMPVYYHDPNAKGSREYLDVAKELIERI